MRSRLQTLIAWFVASRLLIAALGVIGVATFATATDHGAAVTTTTAELNPINVWHKWDSIWYEQIARHGYGWELDTLKGQAAAGYFPLYPMLVRLILLAAPTLSFFWTATVISNVASFIAIWLLVTQLIARDDIAGRAMAIMMTSAGSFYLSIPYTEGLFLLLVVGTLVATRKRQYELAGLLAGLSATTRVHGLALVAVPALACWLDATLDGSRRWLRAAATVALFALPFAIYVTWLADVQGSWNAFVARQSLWGNPSPYPFQALIGLIDYPTRIAGWLHGAFWFLTVGLLIRYWRRLPLGEALFCAGALVISTQQDAFYGIYRHVVPLVPLTIALAHDRDDIRRTIIGINLIYGVIMILAFVTGNRITV